jgi:amino acid permease
MLGSMAIAVNSLAGPAILQLPATYQEAGIMPTTITLILVGLLSSLCSLHMANIVSKVPGNKTFDKEVR